MSWYLILAIICILVGDGLEVNVTGKITSKNDVAVDISNGSVVSETQHTTCSIKTDEVVAKAQSTASRILTGVCTADEMTKAFRSMERKLSERLEEFQRNLTALIQCKPQSGAQKKSYRSSKLSAIKSVDYILDENVFKNYT